MSKQTLILGVGLLAALLLFNFTKGSASDNESLSEAIKNGAVLLDVRTPGEFSQGNVNGSINIPVGELSSRLTELNKEKTIVVYCLSGGRSARATKILKGAGFTKVIDGKTWLKVKAASEKTN